MKNFFCKIFVLVGMVLFSQLPLFVDQYSLRLEGHLSECNRQIEAFRQAAREGNKSLPEYIEKFVSSNDEDFHREGLLIKETVSRGEFLQKASLSLKESSLLSRPCIFIRYSDEKVIADAWKSYSPGFSFTADGLVWSLFGAIFGLLLFAGFRGLFPRKPNE